MPMKRQLGTRAYSALFSLLLGKWVTDATSGIRAFRCSILNTPGLDIAQPWLDRYELEPYLLWKALELGLRVLAGHAVPTGDLFRSLVVTATLEEASRWAAQMEEMGFGALHFYPTSEASPYEPFDPEQETLWGQLQVLALTHRPFQPTQPWIGGGGGGGGMSSGSGA
mgnify:CR=1 FL=1